MLESQDLLNVHCVRRSTVPVARHPRAAVHGTQFASLGVVESMYTLLLKESDNLSDFCSMVLQNALERGQKILWTAARYWAPRVDLLGLEKRIKNTAWAASSLDEVLTWAKLRTVQ